MKYPLLIIWLWLSFFQWSYATVEDSLKVEQTIEQVSQLIRERNYDEALSLCQNTQKQQATTLLKYPLLAAKVEHKMGAIHYNAGDDAFAYQQAQTHYENALTIRKKHLSKEHPDLIHTYYLLLYLNSYYKKFDETITYGSAIIEDIQLRSSTDSSKLGTALLKVGAAYVAKKDFYQSQSYLNRASSIFEQLQSIRSRAEVWHEKGKLYKYLKQYPAAIDAYKEAIALTQSIENEYMTANFRHNLALVYIEMENHEKALEYFQKTLDFYEPLEKSKGTWLRLATVFGQMSRAYLGLNDWEQALSFNTKALELRNEYLGTAYHPHLAASFDNRGDIFFQQKRYGDALEQYHQGLQSLIPDLQDDVEKNPNFGQQSIVYPTQLFTLLFSKAKTFQALAENENDESEYSQMALKTYQVLDTLIVKIRKEFKEEGSGYSLVEEAIPVYEAAIWQSLQLYEQTEDAQYLETAYSFCAKNKAILLLESWQNEQAKSAGIPSSLLKKERKLKEQIQALETAIYELAGGKEKQKLAAKEQQLFETKRIHHQLIADFEEDYPAYKRLKTNFSKPYSIEQIQEKLDEDMALFEFFTGENYIFAFVISKKEVQHFWQPNPPLFAQTCRELRALVDSLSISLEDQQMGEVEKRYAEKAYQVYQWLLQKPLEYLNKEKIKRLQFIPDGDLLLLSFDFLWTENPKEWTNPKAPYLLQQYAISTAYSNQLLFDRRKQRQMRRELKDFGGFGLEYDPVTLEALNQYDAFKNDSIWLNRSVGKLVYSDDEVKEIAALFGNKGQIWLNEAATLKDFLQAAPDFQVLHLAMHGIVIEDNPALSALIFTKTNDTTEFLLKAADLQNLKLQADMAVLSACHTGYGTLHKGEGIRSLARSFTYAGIPSLIASLWSASDAATKEILVLYYQYLLKGLSKDVALQKAKLDYLENSPPSFSAPTYWSHLVVIGDNSPLETRSIKKYLLAGIFIMVGGVLVLFLKKRQKANDQTI